MKGPLAGKLIFEQSSVLDFVSSSATFLSGLSVSVVWSKLWCLQWF